MKMSGHGRLWTLVICFGSTFGFENFHSDFNFRSKLTPNFCLPTREDVALPLYFSISSGESLKWLAMGASTLFLLNDW